MNTQTSLVAEQFRLQQWAEQIRDCQNRPSGMRVEQWCELNGITKANYYYRLKRVRKACLTVAENNSTSFIELPVPVNGQPIHTITDPKALSSSDVAAVLHFPDGLSVEIRSGVSADFVRALIGACNYVK